MRILALLLLLVIAAPVPAEEDAFAKRRAAMADEVREFGELAGDVADRFSDRVMTAMNTVERLAEVCWS